VEVERGAAGGLHHLLAEEVLLVGRAGLAAARDLDQPVVLAVAVAEDDAVAAVVADEVAGRAVAERPRGATVDDRLELVAAA
jgi:hypothetical protein